ncbi:MAG: FAD-dependent oxidoreductase [Thermaerobacter sp.]|nr:FAD-dependent oxidoreductase [Thermaerobacter sp.]
MVVVVGGGATGLGVAWDLVQQGVPVTVVEQGDLGQGTSGRFHGLLHSGARYAVEDPGTARDCWTENQILRRIAPGAVEATGGYFVATAGDAEEYEERWLLGCQTAGIPVRPVPVAEARQRVPALGGGVRRVYGVPDGVLEGFSLLLGLAKGIVAQGGAVWPRTRLTRVASRAGSVSGVELDGAGGRRTLACSAVVNAAGPWAGEVSTRFEDPIALRLASGTMLVFAHRQVPLVINRLAPPGDGDILVPHRHVSIFGTTDVPVAHAGALGATVSEVQRLMELGGELYPGIEQWRVLRAFAGIRPLFDGGISAEGWVSREFAVIDHGRRGGMAGAFSVVGGKWTTYRKMAQETANAVMGYLGIRRTADTATLRVPLDPGPGSADSDATPLICECERVSAAALARQNGSLSERRVATWFGMGPCQGTFCGDRAAQSRARVVGVEAAEQELAAFRAERAKGMVAVRWGRNAQQEALQQAIRWQTLGEREERP